MGPEKRQVQKPHRLKHTAEQGAVAAPKNVSMKKLAFLGLVFMNAHCLIGRALGLFQLVSTGTITTVNC